MMAFPFPRWCPRSLVMGLWRSVWTAIISQLPWCLVNEYQQFGNQSVCTATWSIALPIRTYSSRFMICTYIRFLYIALAKEPLWKMLLPPLGLGIMNGWNGMMGRNLRVDQVLLLKLPFQKLKRILHSKVITMVLMSMMWIRNWMESHVSRRLLWHIYRFVGLFSPKSTTALKILHATSLQVH